MSKQINLTVEGMTCTSCATGVKKFLEKKGATGVFVSFENNEARFVYDEAQPLEPLLTGITKLGYTVHQDKKEEEFSKNNPLTKLKYKLIFSIVFTAPLLAHMFTDNAFLNNAIVQLLFSLPVVYIGFTHFGKSALASVKNKYPNMDVLIFVGFLSALLYSLYGLFVYYESHHIHNFMFFETAASIVTFALAGAYMERKSVSQTTTAIAELIKIQPQKAKVILSDMQIKEVLVSELKIDDLIKINTGDKIPADAEIIEGEGTLNESMLTGENLPVIKNTGQLLIAGTIAESGNFKAKVIRIGSETLLSKVIELVKTAQEKRPKIQRIGDKVSYYFVTGVLALALLAFVLNLLFGVDFKESLIRSVAILVISCPCAIGLATPTAIAVAVGMAARKGILIKGAETLETLSSTKTIVFDKTGTLTTGNFKIKELTFYSQYPQQEVLDIIYTMEQYSSHPIAKSVIREIKGNTNHEVFDVIEKKGLGLEAVYKGNTLQLGSKKFINHEGNFDLGLTINNELICTLSISDEIKEDAKKQLKILTKSGFQLVLLSGDKKENCKEVAKQLNITTVYAEKLPHEKLEIIEQLRKEGSLIMVGDGVNDAPSLSAANVGISISGSTGAALQSAQVVLTSGNEFFKLVQLITLSKNTIITIKQNYFWALAYNVVAIPLAALGFLSPIIGSLSMAFSDLIVVGNSLLLRRKK